MTSYFQKAMASKGRMRNQLAALPIVEKMQMLDAMRERALVLQANREAEGSSSVLHEHPTPYLGRKSGKEE